MSFLWLFFTFFEDASWLCRPLYSNLVYAQIFIQASCVSTNMWCMQGSPLGLQHLILYYLIKYFSRPQMACNNTISADHFSAFPTPLKFSRLWLSKDSLHAFWQNQNLTATILKKGLPPRFLLATCGPREVFYQGHCLTPPLRCISSCP